MIINEIKLCILWKNVIVIKRVEQNNFILRFSLNAEVVTSQQNERTLPTRLSKLNKSTCVCCSNLVGQYFKETLEISNLAGK